MNEKIQELLKNRNARIAAGTLLGLSALLLIVRTATPSSINIYIDGGKKCNKKCGSRRKKS